MLNKDEKLLAALIYIASFFTAFIGPLIIWLIKKEESSFIDFHGREYLNFLISYTIYGIVATVLCFVVIGFLILPVLGLAGVIFTIIAAVKAYEGKEYRIPLIFRII
ncbi:DUF4870 domain-containing protein [Peribacillus cavernae]|uniref:DUF4870 domain-containing protein n=1 Tax=Peribacillus cavernae TaxID=1674310 RepID=A0A3S0WCQ2_9BACI|nr:DUF4870 domain-containing protein [Peribacillus cavernae]MDQ0217890.1 putative Tic20 family protein [Peribacillus cavernae]RUQ32553.1 DUF4870 domain-containing protein [Peribacillus cavernae]